MPIRLDQIPEGPVRLDQIPETPVKPQQPAQPQQLATAGMTYPYIPKEEAGRRERVVKATSRGVAQEGAAVQNIRAKLVGFDKPTIQLGPPPSRFGVPVTPERAKMADVEARRLKESSQLLWDVSKNPEIAAVGGDTLDTIIDLTFENIPYITATTGAYTLTGPTGAFVVGTAVAGNNARQTARDFFRQQNQGKDPTPEQEKHANRVGWGTGIIVGAIEAAGGKGVEAVAQRAISKLNSKMAAGAATFSVGTLVESLEEGVEEIAAITGEKTYRDVNWNETVKRVTSSVAGGAFLGGTFKTMGVAGRGIFSSPVISEPLSQAGKIQPISEAGLPQVVGPTEQPTDIPPGSNVYRGKETGKIYVETPAQMGAKETQVTEEVPSGEGTKLISKETGEELEFATDLAVSGRSDLPSGKQVEPGAEAVLKTPTPEEELETAEEAEVAEKELEVEAYQEVEPNLYIGNVTGGMRKRMTEGTGLKPEDVKGFTEKGWPTKRTKVKLTKGEAEEYLDWLEDDLKQRLDENKINTRKDMALANADWGDIKTLRNVLALDPVARPFKIIPSQEEGIVYRDRGEIEALKNEIKGLRKRLASYFLEEREAGLTPEQTGERNTVESEILEKKQLVAQLERAKGKTVKVVKDTRSVISGAVEPSRLQESKMTVGEVLRAVLRRSERYARMAYIGGRKELRAALRAKVRAKKRLDAALKVIKQDIPKSVDIVYRDAIDTIRGQIDPSFRSEAATKRLESLRDFVKRNPEQAKNIPVALLKTLEQTPLNDYTIEQIEELAASIQKLKDLGGLRRRLETAEYERGKQKDLKALSEGSTRITERDMRKADEIGKKLDFNDRMKNKLSRVLNMAAQKKRAITPTDVLVDLMDGGHGTYDGPNFRIFKRTMDKDWGRYLDRLDVTVKEVIELVNSTGLDDGNFERAWVYAALQQEGGRQKLLDSGYAEEEIDQIKLSPEELQFYNLVREKFDELAPLIDNIMRNVFNEKLERVKNYAPFMTDYEAMSDYELRDIFSDRVIEHPETFKKEVKRGFTITRTGGKQRVKGNLMEVFLRHSDNASYFIEFGSDIKRLQEIASTSSYRDAVGDAGQEEMCSWLDLMARKGLVGQDKTVPVLNIYRKHVGAAVIGFKLSSALVNTTPLLDGAGLIGRYAFTGASAVATNPQLRGFLIKNFPEVRHRMGGDIEFLEFGKSTIEKVERAGFWALQKIDGIANASIVAGAYQKYLDEHGLAFNMDKVNEDARDYAQLIARRTQSSAFFKDLPSAFTRGTFTGNKSLDRLAFQFQSFMLNRWSLIEHDMLRAGIKERDVGKLANMFFWLSMAGFAEMGLRKLSKELIALITGKELDDWSETFTEEIVKNMLQNIPFVSQAMSIYSYGSIPVPSIALANEIANKIKWLRRTNDPDKKLLMGLELLTMIIGTAVGMPGTIQLAEVLRSISKDNVSGGAPHRLPTRPPTRRPPTRRPPTRRPG